MSSAPPQGPGPVPPVGPFGKLLPWLPIGVALCGGIIFFFWLLSEARLRLAERVPGTDRAPGAEAGSGTNAVLAGTLTPGPGSPSDLPGNWPGFRGPDRSGIGTESASLARTWEGSGPRELWAIDVGEGYAGAAVAEGRVYLMDYDREKKHDAVRCLSLADGKEIWRFAYPVAVKRNHGMSRTVPTIQGDTLVAMGPKCHVVCLNAKTGQLKWGLDLVKQFGTVVPPWYAGQCPLIDDGKVILAPAGRDVLLMAVDLETGAILWQTPNPKGWKMTHTSLVTMDLAGERTYVYCASLGVAGVSAKDGRMLWDTTDWKISIATVPSPVVLPGGRLFLSGGYNAGSLMLEAKETGGEWTVQTVYKLAPEIFGATQQTPVLHNGHLYGIRPDGQFVCLDLDQEGKVLWASGPNHNFGLGPLLLADGLIFAMNDSGTLSLIEAVPDKFSLLAQAQVLKGRESWGPMALAGTRLLVRDLTRMACLEVGR